MTMAKLAVALVTTLERPVVDRTGVEGVFDFNLNWTTEESARPPSIEPEQRRAAAAGSTEGPSIFTALQQQLGLRLQPEKLTVEMLLVDRCDRVPAAN